MLFFMIFEVVLKFNQKTINKSFANGFLWEQIANVGTFNSVALAKVKYEQKVLLPQFLSLDES